MAGAAALFRKKKQVDMTEGSILRHLVTFAMPLFVGNLFQMLYNMVDTWVVGNYVSDAAMGAVGSVGPITNLLIGFFTGLANGSGVVVSQYWGAKRPEEVRRTVHTAMVLTFLMGVAFTFLGIAITPVALQAMQTAPEVLPESAAYLTIYFAGVLGLVVYNMGAGILRASGDSRRPFWFLVVSAVTNVVLDLVFVLSFGWGVRGVAWATVIAQGVSAVLVLITLLRAEGGIRLEWRALRIDREMLKKILKIGVPNGLQMTITAFSNVFVQGYVNAFGKDMMAGYAAYNKIDQLVLLPIQSIAAASTTFVGQNLGKGDVARVKRGVRTALFFAIGVTLVAMTPVMLFAPQLVRFFNDTPGVVEYGTLLLRWLTPFFLMRCFNQVYGGSMRGAGNSRAPMVIMLSSLVVFRQLYMFVVTRLTDAALPVVLGYPAGWILAGTLCMVFFYRMNLHKSRLVE